MAASLLVGWRARNSDQFSEFHHREESRFNEAVWAAVGRSEMRAKKWLAVCTGTLFVSAGLVRLVWDKVAAVIDDRPVSRIVGALKIAPGQRIADVGSGDGPFIFPLAEQTGETGVVYAVDINPKALQKVERLARKREVGNVHRSGRRDRPEDTGTGRPRLHILYPPSHKGPAGLPAYPAPVSEICGPDRCDRSD